MVSFISTVIYVDFSTTPVDGDRKASDTPVKRADIRNNGYQLITNTGWQGKQRVPHRNNLPKRLWKVISDRIRSEKPFKAGWRAKSFRSLHFFAILYLISRSTSCISCRSRKGKDHCGRFSARLRLVYVLFGK